MVFAIGSLILLRQDTLPLNLSRISYAISWVPTDVLEGGAGDIATREKLLSEIRAAPKYSISKYVESGVLRTLPHFESGKDTSHMRVESYTVDLSRALKLKASPATAVTNQGIAPQYAVLIPQVINGGDIFLNGVWIQGLPKSDRNTRRVWYRPLLVPLPTHVLDSNGDNTLTFIQSTYEPYLIVPNIYVGSYADLSQVAAVIDFISHTLANFSIIFCLAAGIFMMAAWMAASKSALFFYVGGTAIIWSVLFTAALWPAMPTEWMSTWRTVLYGLEGLFIVFMSLCVLHFSGVSTRWPWVFSLLLYIGMAPLMYYLDGDRIQRNLDYYWVLSGVALYIYGIVRLLLHSWRVRKDFARVMATVSLICVLLAFHDYAVLTGWINVNFWGTEDWTWLWVLTEPIYLFHFAVPLYLLVVGKMLLGDYQAKSAQVEAANHNLRVALHTREGELQRIFEAKRLLISQFVQRKEQRRIYQDIHDGVGSRLVSLLFMLKSGRARPDSCVQSLESCIRDLRSVISAHSDSNNELQSSIFELCLNLEEQIEGGEIVLTYDISERSAVILDRPRHLHVVRSCQEMLSNAMKHSGGKHIHVQLESDNTSCKLTVQDDGCGMPSELAEGSMRVGMGVPGLMSRAEALHGQCHWHSENGQGTTVTLRFPISIKTDPLLQG